MPAQPATYVLSTWVFLRALGLIYCAAFASLAVQITGLVGRHGIAPVSAFLDDAKALFGRRRFVRVPTVVWINSSDEFVTFLCWSGVALSLLVVIGVAPMLTLTLSWALYLSLFNVCR